MKVVGQYSDRILIFVIKDYDQWKERLIDSAALLVIVRKVQCSDGCLAALHCQCDANERVRLRGTKSLVFEDRPNVTISELLERHNGLNFVLHGCQHRQALTRLITKETAITMQQQTLLSMFADSGALIESYSSRLSCVIRAFSNEGIRYFTIRRKDGTSGQLCPARMALGVRGNNLALAYWTGSKLFCLSCESPNCGHFRPNHGKYISEEINGDRNEEFVQRQTQIEVPKAQKVFHFDPGKSFKNVCLRQFPSPHHMTPP